MLTYFSSFSLSAANRNIVTVIHKLLPCAGSDSVSNSESNQCENLCSCYTTTLNIEFSYHLHLLTGSEGQHKRQIQYKISKSARCTQQLKIANSLLSHNWFLKIWMFIFIFFFFFLCYCFKHGWSVRIKELYHFHLLIPTILRVLKKACSFIRS